MKNFMKTICVTGSLLWLLALAGCGYYTYIMPVPQRVHDGPPLPLRLSVRAAWAPGAEGVSTSKNLKTLQDYTVDYFSKSRLFESVTAGGGPAEAELLLEITRYQEKVRDASRLRSQESEISVETAVTYSFSSRFFDAPLHGEAKGFGSYATAEALNVRMHQSVSSQAMQSVCDAIYTKVTPLLLERKAEIAAWAAAGKPAAMERGESGWETVAPVEVKEKP